MLRWASESHADELEHESKYLWVDQLCIDQDSSAEKSQQVAFMGEIYSTARRTILWLGSKDIYLPEDYIGTHANPASLIFDSRVSSTAGQARLSSVVSNPDWAKLAESHQLSTKIQKMTASQSDILGTQTRERWHRHILQDVNWWTCLARHEYWTRLWIVQELCLSLDVTLWIGAQSMTWDVFDTGSTILGFFDGRHGRRDEGFLMFISWLSEQRRQRTGGSTSGDSEHRWYKTLESAVIETRRQKSVNVLDAVFALGSLVSPEYRVAVDYTISPESLLAEAAAKEVSEQDTGVGNFLDFCFVLFVRLRLLDRGTGFTLRFDCSELLRSNEGTSVGFMVREDGSLVLGLLNGPKAGAFKRIYHHPRGNDRYAYTFAWGVLVIPESDSSCVD